LEKPKKSNKKRKKIIRIIIWTVAVIAVIVVGGIFLSRTLNANKSSETILTKTTALVQRGDVARTLGVSASLNSSETADYNADVSGEVLKINFDEGDFIEAGQVVMLLDTEVTEDTISVYEDQISSKMEQIDNLNDTIEDTYTSIDNKNDSILDLRDDISEIKLQM